MFHYCNWRLWADNRDWLAWQGLTGVIGREEIVATLARESGGLEKMWERRAHLMKTDPEFVAKNRQQILKIQPRATIAAQSEKARKKKKETFKRIGHAQGSANSQYGTRWVTDGDVNKKIKKDDPMPEGFRPGRKIKAK